MLKEECILIFILNNILQTFTIPLIVNDPQDHTKSWAGLFTEIKNNEGFEYTDFYIFEDVTVQNSKISFNLQSHIRSLTLDYNPIRIHIHQKDFARPVSISKRIRSHKQLIFIWTDEVKVGLINLLRKVFVSQSVTISNYNTIVYLAIAGQDSNLSDTSKLLLSSSIFQSANPNLVLLNVAKNITISSWICYLCPYQFELTSGLQPPLSTIAQLNSNGHDRPAFTPACKAAQTEVYRQVEAAMHRTWMAGWTVKAIFGILSKTINFTFSDVDTDGAARLYACSQCTYDEPMPPYPIGRKSLSIIVIVFNQQSFFYCQSSITLEECSGLRVLAHPFEPKIWVSITITMIVISLVYKNAWNGVQVFLWGLFGIPSGLTWTTKQSHLKRLFLALIGFIIYFGLQFPYMAYFTSNVIIPFQQLQIKTNSDLFYVFKFRVLTCTEKEKNHVLRTLASRLGQNDRNFTSKLIANLPSEERSVACAKSDIYPPENSNYLADKVTYLIQAKFASRFHAMIHSKYKFLHCNRVAELWHTRAATINFNSHLEAIFKQRLLQLKAGGIDWHWEAIFMAGVERQTYHRNQAHRHGGGGRNRNDTPIDSLYKLCLIGICLSLIAFIIELVCFKVSGLVWKLKQYILIY